MFIFFFAWLVADDSLVKKIWYFSFFLFRFFLSLAFSSESIHIHSPTCTYCLCQMLVQLQSELDPPGDYFLFCVSPLFFMASFCVKLVVIFFFVFFCIFLISAFFPSKQKSFVPMTWEAMMTFSWETSEYIDAHESISELDA